MTNDDAAMAEKSGERVEERGPGRPRHDRGVNARAAILDSARRVIGERGIEAATIKEIARGAGVAPGLVHYYFTSKEELLFEVLCASHDDVKSQILAAPSGLTPADRVARALEITRRRAEVEPEWYRLRFELFGVGLRNPQLVAPLRALLQTGRDQIGRIAVEVTGPGGAVLGNGEAMGALLLACFDGFALQALVDPDWDDAAAYRLLTEVLQVYLQHTQSTLSGDAAATPAPPTHFEPPAD